MKLLQIGTPHPRNSEFIRRACTLFQIEYHQTESYTVPDEGYDIIWAPCGWINPDAYPRSKILFGPHFFVFPDPSNPLFTKATAEHAKRCVYTCLSDWVGTLYNEFVPQEKQIIPFVALPFGIGDIQPKAASATYDYDCIVYFKNRDPSLLTLCKSVLDAKGLRSKVYSYGSYQRQEYLDTLKRVRFAVWIGSHESQGFGFQECLATNTPIYVYDVKSMKEEYGRGTFVFAHHKEQLLATSGSYWSETCGLKVYTQEEFVGRLDEFIAAIPTYKPAAYIHEIMSDRACFQRILDAFNTIKNPI